MLPEFNDSITVASSKLMLGDGMMLWREMDGLVLFMILEKGLRAGDRLFCSSASPSRISLAGQIRPSSGISDWTL